MSNKKLIIQLMAKLKVCTDPNECEELEDQILLLAEQDEHDEQNEQMYNLSKSDVKDKQYKKTDLDQQEKISDELDPREKIRLQREQEKSAKENRYRSETKLDTVDEELLRTQLMNEALATNDDYAFQKSRKNAGPKNKNRKKT